MTGKNPFCIQSKKKNRDEECEDNFIGSIFCVKAIDAAKLFLNSTIEVILNKSLSNC
jgi:hypothetical protein